MDSQEKQQKIMGFKNKKDRLVSVHELSGEEFGINWFALGTVTVDKAKEFVKELQEAIELVEKINKK